MTVNYSKSENGKYIENRKIDAIVYSKSEKESQSILITLMLQKFLKEYKYTNVN